MPQEPNSIELKAGDSLILERVATTGSTIKIQPSGAFNVRLTRDGKDTGLVTNPDGSAITLSKDNPTLTLTGDGKNSVINIPQTVGQEKTDYVPHLSIKTKNSVTVVNGIFITEKDSTQKAVIPDVPLKQYVAGRQKTSELGDELLQALDATAEEFEKNKDKFGTIENFRKLLDESRDIAGDIKQGGVTDKGDVDKLKGNMNTLLEQTGKLEKSPERDAMQKSLRAITSGNSLAEISKAAIPAAQPDFSRTGSKPDVSAAKRNDIREYGRQLSDNLNGLVKKFERSESKFKDVPEFKTTAEAARDIATNISQTGSAKRADIDKLEQKMGAMLEQAEKIRDSDYSFGMDVERSINQIKQGQAYQKLNEAAPKAPEKKEDKKQASNYNSMSSLPENVLAKARAAVDPMLARQEAVAASQSTNKAAVLAGKVISNTKGQSV